MPLVYISAEACITLGINSCQDVNSPSGCQMLTSKFSLQRVIRHIGILAGPVMGRLDSFALYSVVNTTDLVIYHLQISHTSYGYTGICLEKKVFIKDHGMVISP